MEGDAALDDNLRRMLRELGKALSAAIADSSEAHDALRRLHDEGYSLLILLNRKDEEVAELTAGDDASGAGADGAGSTDGSENGRTPAPAGRSAGRGRGPGEPIFRIDGRDLAFLRSIGIDPTRRVRRRRA